MQINVCKQQLHVLNTRQLVSVVIFRDNVVSRRSVFFNNSLSVRFRFPYRLLERSFD